MLQQEPSVDMSSEAQDMNTAQLPYLSVASHLSFHHPCNGLKDAGVGKDILGSLLFNIVIAHKFLKKVNAKKCCSCLPAALDELWMSCIIQNTSDFNL